MEKVLIISGLQVFPPESGGQLRTANLARSLSHLGHQVEIYSYTGRRSDYLNKVKSSETQVAKNISEYTNRNPLSGLVQWCFYKLNLPPFWLTLMTHFSVPYVLNDKIKKSNFIIIDFPFLHPLKKKTNKKLILNTHNAEFSLYKEKPLISGLVKNLELKAFTQADKILFCHQNDLNAFQIDSFKEKSYILSNGLDLTQFVPNSKNRENLRHSLELRDDQIVFLFTGSQYAPNVEAFLFLKKFEAENRLELQKNRICLIIVGTVSEEKENSETFKVLGRVPDIMPYFSATDFCLNPCISGSGTNVKMFEYLAAKKLILSTDFGTRGLELTDQEDCLIFNETQFLDVLLSAKRLPANKKSHMEERAFKKNIHLLDMTQQLKSLITQW